MKLIALRKESTGGLTWICPDHVARLEPVPYASATAQPDDQLAGPDGIIRENRARVHLSHGPTHGVRSISATTGLDVVGSVPETAARLNGAPEALEDLLFWAGRRRSCDGGATETETDLLVRLACDGAWQKLYDTARPIAARAYEWAKANAPAGKHVEPPRYLEPPPSES